MRELCAGKYLHVKLRIGLRLARLLDSPSLRTSKRSGISLHGTDAQARASDVLRNAAASFITLSTLASVRAPQGRGSHPAQPGSAWWHWRTGTSVVLAALAKPCRPPPANGRSLPSTFLHPANYTVTTILPNCTLDSRYRCASTIRSNGNVLAMIGRSAPAASPSAMYALAAASRVGSSMISWTR